MSIFCQKASVVLGYRLEIQQIKHHKVVCSIPLAPRVIFNLQCEVWAEWMTLPSLELDLAQKMNRFRELGFEIYVATGTPHRNVEYVKRWLQRMEVPYRRFFHCPKEGAKSGIRCEALVDDSPDEIKQFIRKGRQGFLYLQPWNASTNIPKAITVKNLSEILEYYEKRMRIWQT